MADSGFTVGVKGQYQIEQFLQRGSHKTSIKPIKFTHE